MMNSVDKSYEDRARVIDARLIIGYRILVNYCIFFVHPSRRARNFFDVIAKPEEEQEHVAGEYTTTFCWMSEGRRALPLFESFVI